MIWRLAGLGVVFLVGVVIGPSPGLPAATGVLGLALGCFAVAELQDGVRELRRIADKIGGGE